MTDGSTTPTVLVVDDEEALADLYATWIADDYEPRTAYSGEEALEAYDDAVDVVLLDRRMPDLSGDEVLEEIRSRDGDCQVVMVTAVDPDFDIIEMGFDDYITKPVSQEEILTVLERMLSLRAYDDRLQTYYSLVEKRTSLTAEKSEAELESSEEFQELDQRISKLEEELDTTVEEFDDEDFESMFRDLESS